MSLRSKSQALATACGARPDLDLALTWTSPLPVSLLPSLGRSLSSQAHACLRAFALAAVPSDWNSVPRFS